MTAPEPFWPWATTKQTARPRCGGPGVGRMQCCGWWALALGTVAALDVRSQQPLSGDRFAGCMFEIVMLEKQLMGSSFNPKSFWSMNAVLNKAYADRHGYAFTLARPEAEPKSWSQRPAESWYRVPWVLERLQAAQARKETCGWLLYMDSSAFIQDHQVPLSKFLDQIFKDRPLNLRTGGIFQWDVRKSGLVSDKVFFIQVNGHGEDLLKAWRLSSSVDEAMRFEAAEQGTLTELLFPGKVVTRSQKALKLFEAVVPWVEEERFDCAFFVWFASPGVDESVC
ncbi:unnamed protein product [Durusdinium trenchii]|uniref:Uncharacterized protein n=1 Tax=Durusdinium trenchii TaxID=1381693 RepID=A0ABP0RZ17_9DINO